MFRIRDTVLVKLFVKSSALQSAIIAQFIWSGANFVITVFLVRNLSIHEFGLYGVSLAGKQFLLMLVAALLITPMTVLSGRVSDVAQRNRYLSDMVQYYLWVLSGVMVIGVFLEVMFGLPGTAAALFIAGGSAVELQRRINFINGRPFLDVLGGIANFTGTVILLYVLMYVGEFDLETVLLAVGAVNMLWVCFVGSGNWWPRLVRLNGKDLYELWAIGRWVFASNTAAYVYMQSSTFLTLGLVGPAGVAVLELGRQVVALVQPILFGAANLFQPILARSAKSDQSMIFIAKVWRLSLIQVVLGGGMLILVLVFSAQIIDMIVPENTQQYMLSAFIAKILAISMVGQLLWQHLTFGVIALGKPEYGFITRLICAVLLLPVGYWLTANWGVAGAAWSRAVGDIIIFVLSTLMLYRAAAAIK